MGLGGGAAAQRRHHLLQLLDEVGEHRHQIHHEPETRTQTRSELEKEPTHTKSNVGSISFNVLNSAYFELPINDLIFSQGSRKLQTSFIMLNHKNPMDVDRGQQELL